MKTYQQTYRIKHLTYLRKRESWCKWKLPAAVARREARYALYHRIVDLRAAGTKAQEIAGMVNLTKDGVIRILRRHRHGKLFWNEFMEDPGYMPEGQRYKRQGRQTVIPKGKPGHVSKIRRSQPKWGGSK